MKYPTPFIIAASFCSTAVVRYSGNSRNSSAIVKLNSLGGRELIEARRQSSTHSRTPKVRHRLQKSSKRSVVLWPEPSDDELFHEDESEKPDRLLLSSLRFWEVERDLIEERLGHTLASNRFTAVDNDAVIRVYDSAGNVIETHEHVPSLHRELNFSLIRKRRGAC